MSSFRRVGHKGADLIAPGNTLASFDAAVEAGVDMIEFDVLPAEYEGDYATTSLVLAHDYKALRETGNAPTLEDGLAHLATQPFDDIALDVDLKLPGYEIRVVEALRQAGLLDRALISSQYRSSLALIREHEPNVRLGWSVPRARRDWTASFHTVLPALALLAAGRRALPIFAARALRARKVDAIMAHWRLVTPRLVQAVNRAAGELYVWTVDDLAQIQRLERLGVTGVITNDPRLFTALA